MKNCGITLTTILLLTISSNASSALLSRLGGLAYYDTDANLTWLADADYAKSSGYDADGIMDWYNANDWAAGLIVAGVDGWRLPDTLTPDPSCTNTFFNCAGSEMGNLYYNVLGNESYPDGINTGPFSNIHSYYWSATPKEDSNPHHPSAWVFNMESGDQSSFEINDPYLYYVGYAWAVYSGDVNEVPIPATAWLFASGIISLASFTRRKNNKKAQ